MTSEPEHTDPEGDRREAASAIHDDCGCGLDFCVKCIALIGDAMPPPVCMCEHSAGAHEDDTGACCKLMGDESCTCDAFVAAPELAAAHICTCAQPTEAYGALAGPCPGCVERAQAAAP